MDPLFTTQNLLMFLYVMVSKQSDNMGYIYHCLVSQNVVTKKKCSLKQYVVNAIYCKFRQRLINWEYSFNMDK